MDVKQFYAEVNGNYEEALSRLMNDAFIARMVAKFYANNSYNDMISAYEKKDVQALFNAAHALKGVAGNLSLTSLFEVASMITEATRNGEMANVDKEISLLKEKRKIYLICRFLS